MVMIIHFAILNKKNNIDQLLLWLNRTLPTTESNRLPTDGDAAINKVARIYSNDQLRQDFIDIINWVNNSDN